jgi:uncharacterized phiE125 gp8 family phage protein
MPIPLSLLKAHVRVDFNDDDAILALYLSSAVSYFEGATRRLLSQQTRHVRRFDFGPTALPFPPFVSLASVSYVDEAGSTQTLASSKYVVDTTHPIAVVRFLDELPTLHEDSFDRVTIQYVAGWENPPADVVAAVLQLAATSYLLREATASPAAPRFSIDFGVQSVIARWSVPEFEGRLDP